jgi:hypothetical protein
VLPSNPAPLTRVLAAPLWALLSAACALPFPEYDLATGGASTSGGAPTTGGSETTGGSSSTGLLEPNGAPCETGARCESGNCLPDVSGELICCAVDCAIEEPESCGTTGQCFNGTECVRYPDNLVCNPMETCDGSTSFSFRCLDGACMPVGVPCPNGLKCAPGEQTCLDACANAATDCAEAAQCFEGKCQKKPGETCSSNEECISGFCGSTGVGRCCTAFCDGSGETCDFDCDAAGECVLAPSTTVCSPTAVCSDGNQLEATFCDGIGACEAQPETRPCEHNLACNGPDACWNSCGSFDAAGDARCADGYWCNNVFLPPGVFECAEKLNPLQLCNRNSQCKSGTCAGFLCSL